MVRNKIVLKLQVISVLEVDGVDSMEKLVSEKCTEMDLPKYTRDWLADLVEPFVTASLYRAYDFLYIQEKSLIKK